jgi:hypothetical protein
MDEATRQEMDALRSEFRRLQRERVWWGLGNTLLVALLVTGAAAAPGVSTRCARAGSWW